MSPAEYLEKSFNLRNKIILVTGATGQLGKALCNVFIQAGARVIGVDRVLNPKYQIQHPSIEYFTVDISDLVQIKALLEKIFIDYKHIDVLINNAGISVFEPFLERPEQSFDAVMDVNLKGTFWCIQQYARLIKEYKQPSGNIINVGSIYGVISPDPRIYTDCSRNNSEIYGATKAAIIQMTRYFAVHLSSLNIRINCISPGGIFNPDAPQGEDFIKNYSYRCPIGRMGRVEDMVGAFLYLASDASAYTNGQNITIDGGMTAW